MTALLLSSVMLRSNCSTFYPDILQNISDRSKKQICLTKDRIWMKCDD